MKLGAALEVGCFLISELDALIPLCHSLPEVRPGNTKQKGQERILQGLHVPA